MWEDWKQAWREAVENFRRELAEPDGLPQVAAMRRELQAARNALDKLDREISSVRYDTTTEREQEAICRRREDAARRIGDVETVRIAVEFAVRHAERAAVLERKAEVLAAEKALLARDLAAMEKVIEAQPKESVNAGPPREVLEERDHHERDFGKLEKEARERAAEQRLEELKRRMR
jgi:hypothetical protein